jgi:Ras-related protein Rab-18
VPTAEGEAFAGRTGCPFVEASAQTAVDVTEAFNDVVARIIDTPSLWREDAPRAGGGVTLGLSLDHLHDVGI